MKSKNLTMIAAATAMSFVACSDTVSSSGNTPNENSYTETTTTTYTCTDGSVVSDATLCPATVDPVTGEETSGVADSVVVTTITCSDGSVVADAALCPAEVVASSSSAHVRPGSSASVVASSASVVTPVVSTGDDDTDTDIEDAKTLDGTEILLKLAGTTATVENNNGCVTVDGSVATITCPADYYVTGTSTEFQIVVNTPGIDGEGNTGIYLYDATLKSASAPILVVNADKTVLHLVKGTTNSVEDGSTVHVFTNKNGVQDTASAAIYAKDDLNIKGAGTLTVTGHYKNGIQCSNDLKIKNGNITVVADTNGIKGKGSLHISGGTLNVTATYGDGLKSDECNEDANDSCTSFIEGKGYVMISGGTTTVKAGDEGIQAANYVFICDSTEDATLNLTTTGKGISSDNMIYVNGGTTTINSTNDGIAADMNIWMNAGNVTISASASAASGSTNAWSNMGGQSTSSTGKAQGIHADSTLYLNGSTVNIVTAEEGIEAYYIRAQAGITATYGTDDGWNAAGGASNGSSGMMYAGGMGGGMQSSSVGYIIISGGYHYISASGNDIDVLDANGSATQTGGVLILEIPTSTSSQGGMMYAGGFNGGNQGGSSSGSGCAINNAGGLIDTDNGYTITGGVMIGFGSRTEEYPNCSSTSYTSSSYYGSSNAAAKPQGSGSMVIYGGDVSSIAQVETSGMTEVKFPNGVSYMYK